MAMTPEIPKQPYRLSHFSLSQGPAFLGQQIRLLQEQNTTASPEERTAQRISYKSNFGASDRFINYMIVTAFPRRRNSADLLNETALLEPNGERALRFIEANGTVEPRLKFEIIRKLLLADIAKDIDDRSHAFNLRSELNNIQALLDRELFAGKTGQTWPTTTYSTHDNASNLVLAVGDKYPMLVKPGTHIKKFEQQMRYVPNVGFVMSSVREKTREASIGKAIRDAVERKHKTGDDTIKPLEAVQDTMGLQFVVKGTMHNNEPRINILRDKVLAALRTQYGEIQVKERHHQNGAKDEGAQSTEFISQRLIVTIPGAPVPLELMFFGEGDFINNKYHVGGKDRKTKQYRDGAAHSLYEMRRIMDILPVLYPEQIDGALVPGYLGLLDEAVRTINEKSKSLRRSNKIKLWRGRRIRERFISRNNEENKKRLAQSLQQAA